ncbi:MAG: hypothetical protein EA427_06770 [Spirochaetaceae bacterium]|nr:MAG: hypothetical protein EA427_06770 [Spirochaetaceae bacterium]
MEEHRIGHAQVEEVISRLRRAESLDPLQLDRVYRRLILQVHPDHRQGDGELFLYLQEQFSSLRAEHRRRRSISMLEADLDPHGIARDLGITRTLTPRESLYIGLYRFRSLGLTSWKVRVRPALRKRNSRVIRTVLYWGRRYDEGADHAVPFVPAFQTFLRNPGQFLLAEHQATLYFLVRRTMLRGLDWLILYQERGRPATGTIAGDTLRYAHRLAASHGEERPFSALLGMIRWMLEELEGPPLRLRIPS